MKIPINHGEMFNAKEKTKRNIYDAEYEEPMHKINQLSYSISLILNPSKKDRMGRIIRTTILTSSLN